MAARRRAEVTLPQYRALVVLASRGPQRVIDISTELEVIPSTGAHVRPAGPQGPGTPLPPPTDRREVRLTLTPAGRHLVQQVTVRRRDALVTIVASMPVEWDQTVATALRTFAAPSANDPNRTGGYAASKTANVPEPHPVAQRVGLLTVGVARRRKTRPATAPRARRNESRPGIRRR